MPIKPPKKWQQCQNEHAHLQCVHLNRISKKIKTSAYGVGHCNDGHPTTHHLRHMVDSNWITLLTIPNLWNWWLRVMQDSRKHPGSIIVCFISNYHSPICFWSQGPSLAPATWSPPSPRPTPSTHSGKPLAITVQLHFPRSLVGHKRSYIREMNM